METTIMGHMGYRIWGIWGSYYNLPRTIFCLLKWDYKLPDPMLDFRPAVGKTNAFLVETPSEKGDKATHTVGLGFRV